MERETQKGREAYSVVHCSRFACIASGDSVPAFLQFARLTQYIGGSVAPEGLPCFLSM